MESYVEDSVEKIGNITSHQPLPSPPGLTTFQAENAVSPHKNLPTWKLRIGICVSDKDAAMAGRTTGMQDSLIHFRKIIAKSGKGLTGNTEMTADCCNAASLLQHPYHIILPGTQYIGFRIAA